MGCVQDKPKHEKLSQQDIIEEQSQNSSEIKQNDQSNTNNNNDDAQNLQINPQQKNPFYPHYKNNLQVNNKNRGNILHQIARKNTHRKSAPSIPAYSNFHNTANRPQQGVQPMQMNQSSNAQYNDQENKNTNQIIEKNRNREQSENISNNNDELQNEITLICTQQMAAM